MSRRPLAVCSQKEEGRFPEGKELKQLVRDAIDPNRNLGHSEDDYDVEAKSTGSGTLAFNRLLAELGFRRR